MDAANLAAAAALKGSAATGDAVMAEASAAAPAEDAAMGEAAPTTGASDIDRIAAALGYEMCSDSDDDDDDDALELVRAPASAHAGWDDEDAALDKAPRTEHEILAPPPAPKLADIVIGDGALREIGVVEHAATAASLSVVVQGAEGAAAVVEDTALCASDRRPLGVVAEVFGPVRAPFYVLRLFDAADAAAVAAYGAAGAAVFAVADRVAYVVPEALDSRGCDASNAYDEELGDDAQDDSDDEAAAASKKRTRDRPPPGDVLPPRPPPGATY